MTLMDEQRIYLVGVVNEMMSNLESVARLPRIESEEWHERFGELPHPDDDHFEPLRDTKTNRAILAERDPRLVWSAIPDPSAPRNYLIVPGYWPNAKGWHRTSIPWDPAIKMVGVYRPEPMFAPIPGECWIVEMYNGTDDPDYFGPFTDEWAAHDWRNSKGVPHCVVIHVLPPTEFDKHRAGDEEPEGE